MLMSRRGVRPGCRTERGGGVSLAGVARVRPYFALAAVCAVLLAGCGITSGDSGSGDGEAATSPQTRTTVRAATTTTSPSISYQVKRGDTLAAIARKFHVSIQKIIAANLLADPDRLAEGQTLMIPPVPPVGIVVTPDSGPAGQDFQLELVGASPAEKVTFAIDSPRGTYRGRAHTATDGGEVSAKYKTTPVDATGSYTVTATGDMGTTARATFVVVAPPTTSHT
jgi:LysM repeat protein